MKKTFYYLCLLSCFFSSSLAYAEKVAVILSHTLQPYEETWNGINRNLSREITRLDLENNRSKVESFLQDIQASQTSLLVTIGSEATLVAKKYVSGVPVVYTMVLTKQDFGASPSAGVLMQTDMPTQIQNLKTLFPTCKTIGVLYNPRYSSDLVKQARQAAELRALTLRPIAIESQSDIPTALKNMTQDQIDLLWTVVDPLVAQPEAAQLMIQHSLNEKVPFVAMSKAQVKAGALAAFSVDFKDLGAQTAEVVQNMLKAPKNMGSESPRRLILFVNSDTQKKLGINAFPSISGVQIITE